MNYFILASKSEEIISPVCTVPLRFGVDINMGVGTGGTYPPPPP